MLIQVVIDGNRLMKEKPNYDPMMDKPNNEDDLGDKISLSTHKYSRTVIKRNKFSTLDAEFHYDTYTTF